MAAEFKETLDVEVELVVGAGGIFDVTVDEQLVFSKKDSGNRFPEPGEVVAIVRKNQSSS